MNSVAALLERSTPIDYLDRREFVERMFTISQNMAKNNENISYALNGDWGTGKTFVLNMFQKKVETYVQTEENPERYLVFRYNCWENDYYEEPLVAIVATILEKIDSMQSLSADDKNTIKGVLKSIGKVLADNGIKWAENELGLEEGQLKEFVTAVIDGTEAGQNATKKATEFDQYGKFKKALKALQSVIKQFSKDQTIIFLVDELDRCLPEYAIKVLERLHHLFEDIPNVQMILSVDRKQLEHTIMQLFGPDTDSRKYLQKFIQFELNLDPGSFVDSFDQRFARFSSHFTEEALFRGEDTEIKNGILSGIDMRRRIALVNRCEIVHSLIARKDTNYTSDYLCVELFLALLHDSGFSQSEASNYFKEVKATSTEMYEMFPPKAFIQKPNHNTPPTGLIWMSKECQKNYYDFLSHPIPVDTLLGCLYALYAKMVGYENRLQGANALSYCKDLISFGLEYWKLLRIVS